MADSFQKEIPPARINITLDVETNGVRKKKELPLKILVMGDFSGGKTKGSIAERERININKNNFNRVIADLNSELKYSTSKIPVKLKITSLRDFHPEYAAQQIPELRNLLAMRNLLKDLKANVLDNNEFRHSLESIVKNQSQLNRFQARLSVCCNLPSLERDNNL
jgi:type VI secretion system protein ImpB